MKRWLCSEGPSRNGRSSHLKSKTVSSRLTGRSLREYTIYILFHYGTLSVEWICEKGPQLQHLTWRPRRRGDLAEEHLLTEIFDEP